MFLLDWQADLLVSGPESDRGSSQRDGEERGISASVILDETTTPCQAKDEMPRHGSAKISARLFICHGWLKNLQF
jgi:hypothetical protein